MGGTEHSRAQWTHRDNSDLEAAPTLALSLGGTLILFGHCVAARKCRTDKLVNYKHL